MLKARRNKHNLETICDEDGNRYEGDEVAPQFVNHFNKFLGKTDGVEPLMEGIFKNVLNEEDARGMTRDVTDLEIKEAIFDINSKKVAEPDGYTSGFFKKAWDLIGRDIATPNKVSDFRPIACCNVIYKCISKILTKRIQEGLAKIVHINQSAFISGRHIQDNILIAQELLREYNRKSGPKRCTMQIDIQKAYDTLYAKAMLDLPKVVKKSLDEFSKVSGLIPNLEKSVIFFEVYQKEISRI
uniref:uncharacterized protein LOC122583383 n=1 Tax=Erigeron canadensis TaxID=72917 RepID=UPI001CB8D1E5|nr:uncharacterized protein LOC122583383 [Erigeron canadensis]